MARRVRGESVMIAMLLFIAAILSLLSLLLIRSEHSRQSVLREYEAERIASALLDSYREGNLDARGGDAKALGFGVYSLRGEALARFGSAPAALSPNALTTAHPRFQNDALRHSVTLVRPVGVAARQKSMTGAPADRSHGFRGPMSGHLPMERNAAALIFLQLPAEEYSRAERRLRSASYAAPLAIALMAALAGYLYWKNAVYRKRMAAHEQLARLGEAARTLAHEIRNPLGAIRIQTGILRKALPGDGHPNITVIEKEVARLALLTERIGTLLGDPRGSPQPLRVMPFLQDLLPRLGGRLTLIAQPDVRDAAILFDPERLRSIFENLITNALESDTPEPPEIVVSADATQVEIAVLDRGTGIPSDDRERVFDPFFTRKTKGSGVGLAIARRFAEAAGAEIRLEPRPDGGTRARLLAKRVPG